MTIAEFLPMLSALVFVAIGFVLGFLLGQSYERQIKSEDRVRIEAFKVNFKMDAERIKAMATSIKRKADELYSELDRAEKTIITGSVKPIDSASGPPS